MFVLADQSKKMDLQELLILTEAENDCEIGLGKKVFSFVVHRMIMENKNCGSSTLPLALVLLIIG